jgi:hypothetical protein
MNVCSVYVYTYVFVCTYVCYVCYVCMYVCIYTYIQMYTHTHTMYVCMPSPLVNVSDSFARAGGERVTTSRGERGAGVGGQGEARSSKDRISAESRSMQTEAGAGWNLACDQRKAARTLSELGRELEVLEQLGGGGGGGGDIHDRLQGASLTALTPVTPEAPPPSRRRKSMSESDLLDLQTAHAAPPALALPVLDTSSSSSYSVSIHVCVRAQAFCECLCVCVCVHNIYKYANVNL